MKRPHSRGADDDGCAHGTLLEQTNGKKICSSNVPCAHPSSSSSVEQIGFGMELSTPHDERLQQEASSIGGTVPDARLPSEKTPAPLAKTEIGNTRHRSSLLQQLTQQAQDMHNSATLEAGNIERLQQRLDQGHAALGDLVNKSLRIQSAIKDRQQQNKQDKDELEKARARATARRADLTGLLERMTSIMEDISEDALP